MREGTPRWQQTFGVEGGIFDHFFRTEEAKQKFIQGMHGFGVLSSPKVVEAFDLSRFRRLVDLGGATGHLAIAACERYPSLRAVVFDLPQVIGSARVQIGKSPIASPRIEVVAGDFFRDELPEADLFAMSRIVHDWSEDKIHALLTRIYQRLPAGGGILLAEKTSARGQERPDIGPAAIAEHAGLHGRQRTHSERVPRPAGSAGFRDVQGSTTGTTLDAILAVKNAR